VGIKLVDNSGLESLEKQLAEYADGYPTERSDDPATRVARHVRDDLLSCQREWQEQRSTGKQTNYAHYYTVLCRAYFDAEVLESEPPDGWFRSASMAILATFSAMRQAEKGASLETALMDQLSTAFLARTLAWAG